MQVGRIEYSPDYGRSGGTWLDNRARSHVEHARRHGEQSRSMTGFFVGLTDDQKEAALAYDGPETHGDPEYANDNFTPAEARELVGLSNTRRGDWLQLYSGKQFWPMDPRAEDVEIDDIAHSLSMQCRYAGHCVKFYSVAEHSVHIAGWLYVRGYTSDEVMAGLLHDATEAYLVDVPRPVKPFLPGYKEAEAAVWQAVATRFELPVEMPAIVKEVDNRIIGDERANMRPCAADWYATGEPLGIELQYWSPAEAEARFLERFRTVERARQWIRRAA